MAEVGPGPGGQQGEVQGVFLGGWRAGVLRGHRGGRRSGR